MRRKIEKFKDNPFIQDAVVNTVPGTRIITGNKKDDSLIVQPGTGEVLGITGFYQRIQVDKTHFIKMYIGGIKTLRELSAAGVKVFTVIYERMLDDDMYGKDRIDLYYDMLDEATQSKISRAVWFRGINDLLRNNIIAETMIASLYWLNIDYFFNGNRFAVCKEYVLEGKTPTPSTEKNITPEPEQLPEGGNNNG